uniref:NADH dehydrogenase subunit 6 n=1 Tax=Tremoctopus violaceus TaxID=102883 RepID=A0A3S6PWX8_9MOLL|nr:NADH dehydrogenase subunit 6 [Tremoctopus violaceus]ATR85799.1 NADH dehydrogenase subunit 6 [Tremoctopus violaceus]WBK26775.1 NADH dehydrogenase subunit 6 [Tremoctopus violaceus]
MVLVLILSFSFFIVSMLFTLIQPLSLGFVILLLSFFMSVMISFFVYSWYGFVLFLVYVGGLLVMFMYIISLIPNLIFLSKGLVGYFLVSTSIFMLTMSLFIYNYLDFYCLSEDMLGVKSLSMGMSSMLMGYYNFFLYIFMGLVLLLVLISVIKICYYCDGPLRVFKYKYA